MINLIDWAERGWLPDRLIRWGIRRLLHQRLNQVTAKSQQSGERNLQEFANEIARGPLVVCTEDANEQHYEVPAEFFRLALGKQMKYSSAFWPQGVSTLDAAEESMLNLTMERADLQDGQSILELGCGWGSLTLWMASRLPQSQITAVSNSASQRAWIEQRCQERGLTNVQVITSNIADLQLSEQFDRVVSVEMFEHVRNHQLLLDRISSWMQPDAKLFVHIFCHKEAAYLFEEQSSADWMTRHFFRGGMMPAEGLLAKFNQQLSIDRQWRVSGLHYARTCEAWLKNIDQQKTAVRRLFREAGLPDRQFQRWRMFFMACAELFAFRQGTEWGVAHYLLSPVAAKKPKAAAVGASS